MVDGNCVNQICMLMRMHADDKKIKATTNFEISLCLCGTCCPPSKCTGLLDVIFVFNTWLVLN